ncbi:MAG: hypothetical protein LBU10_01220 [Endomicrobium sp.]|jgi:hypothetical protein|nr:hypothetical protein [Endomicrobium sp.]
MYKYDDDEYEDYNSNKTFRDLLENYVYKTSGKKPESGLMYLLTNISKDQEKPRHDSLYGFIKTYLDNKDM